MENATTIYHRSKTRLNKNLSLLFLNLFPKSTDVFFANLSDLFHFSIFWRFLGKLKKIKLGIFVLFVAAFITYTSRNHTAQEQSMAAVV